MIHFSAISQLVSQSISQNSVKDYNSIEGISGQSESLFVLSFTSITLQPLINLNYNASFVRFPSIHPCSISNLAGKNHNGIV